MATRTTSPKSVSKSFTANYQFQHYFAPLFSGHTLKVQTHQRVDPATVFFGQGTCTGSCGAMVLCSILVCFDLAKSVALQSLGIRKFGIPAQVFKAFAATWHKGVEATEYVELIESLQLPIRLTLRQQMRPKSQRNLQSDKPQQSNNHQRLDDWIVDCLLKGELVALVIVRQKCARERHWVLALGVGGYVAVDRTKQCTEILLLDPASSEPRFTMNNSRLRLAESSIIKNDRLNNKTQHLKPLVWMHESLDFMSDPVLIESAIRFKLVDKSLA
jgi:hypothetical protein